MTCSDCSALRAEVAELQERLDYYSTRAQRILDKTATAIESALDEGDINAAFLNQARQFLRDQGIIDLRTGDTPTNHLVKAYPFAVPGHDGDGVAGSKAEEA